MGLISRVSSRTYRSFTYKNVRRSKSHRQKCGHVRRYAARRHRRRHPSSREAQHRKRYCRVHQEGIRQEVQPNLALYCRPKLWLVRNTRNQTLHILLSRPGRYSVVQVRIKIIIKKRVECVKKCEEKQQKQPSKISSKFRPSSIIITGKSEH